MLRSSIKLAAVISALAISAETFRSSGPNADAASTTAVSSGDLLRNITPAQPTTRQGQLTYSLSNGSENWDPDARNRIIHAMDAAVAIYNANGEFDRHVTANYSPGTPTADANFGGWINFGGQIGTRTALHEIAHTLGVGTCQQWQRLAKGGKWTGHYAIQQLKEIDGPDAVLHCDHQHFWPYGLNYEREGGEENFKQHVKMVIALRADMGLGPPPGISVAALNAAKLEAAAAHDEVDKDQKALDALPAALQKSAASQPDVINATQSVATAKAAQDTAIASVMNSLGTDPDYLAAKSVSADAHRRLDDLKSAGASDPSSPDLLAAANAVLKAESNLAKIQANALASDAHAAAAKKAYSAAIENLSATRTAAQNDAAPQKQSTSAALQAAIAKAAAADQKVVTIENALAQDKDRQTHSSAGD
jgi:hypothetical protein